MGQTKQMLFIIIMALQLKTFKTSKLSKVSSKIKAWILSYNHLVYNALPFYIFENFYILFSNKIKSLNLLIWDYRICFWVTIFIVFFILFFQLHQKHGDIENLINLSSPRLAKTVPFVILLCLMADDFTRQWRASGWERVKIWLNL